MWHRRHVLLGLVLGTFLGIVGITAGLQAVLVSEHVTASMLESVVDNDASMAHAFVSTNLSLTDLSISPASDDRAAVQTARLAALVQPDRVVRIELATPDGTLLLSDAAGLRGTRPQREAAFADAAAGLPSAMLLDASSVAHLGKALPVSSVLRIHLPIVVEDRVAAVLTMWRNAAAIVNRVEHTRWAVLQLTMVAAGLAALVLVILFRGAQARIQRQTAELLDAARRDPVTELPNHGAAVAMLAEHLDAARTAAKPLAIGVFDIDNFRSLNEVHGYRAGDEALRKVATTISERVPGALVGRYGPDEFLVILAGHDEDSAMPSAQRVLAALRAVSLDGYQEDALPITASAGVATFPESGESIATLLSVATVALDEAKASGGNAARAATTPNPDDVRGGFSVLQGLVIAVDTKDRYTRRHSEDVARYALFLAEQLQLDAETLALVRTAGLLHDVGKIAIPDQILRKPGRLTAEETAIIQQHVALGDAIVRGVPGMEMVRRAIRHHHERWDGKGYLDRLQGEQIPLIARLIAVGDMFSAMTTSRPYRKALPIDEALRRVEDAAGTQLDERLALAFVSGIRSAARPPLPGDALIVRSA